MGETLSLWTLFFSSFLAATILPGGSELILFGVLKAQAQLYWPALVVATAGNTLGGMTSYLLGRFISDRQKLRFLERVRRHGTPILLLSWVPVVGDALCIAAGWLRLSPWLSAAFMAVGKFARYVVVATAATG